MKTMIVAVAAMLIASPALAQTAPAAPASVPTSSCGNLPTVPTLPDGASASREEMERGNEAFNTWSAAARAVVECRHTEAEALQAQWTTRVSEHNAMVEGLNVTNTSWQAEAAEFNARNERRR